VKDIKAQIAAELYTAFQRLGTKSELLRIIGNYGGAGRAEVERGEIVSGAISG